MEDKTPRPTHDGLITFEPPKSLHLNKTQQNTIEEEE